MLSTNNFSINVRTHVFHSSTTHYAPHVSDVLYCDLEARAGAWCFVLLVVIGLTVAETWMWFTDEIQAEKPEMQSEGHGVQCLPGFRPDVFFRWV